MANQNLKEFSWRFQFTESSSQKDTNKFIEDFVFLCVEKKGWYCGGGTIGMTMYDLKGNATINELKNGLIEYATVHKSDILSAIIITDLDEASSEFIDKEIIKV